MKINQLVKLMAYPLLVLSLSFGTSLLAMQKTIPRSAATKLTKEEKLEDISRQYAIAAGNYNEAAMDREKASDYLKQAVSARSNLSSYANSIDRDVSEKAKELLRNLYELFPASRS